ncbi:23.5L [Yaba monkey tumor virus]|uniref:23.5L n=1 Tax=Yaba monkey tumor virus (strain VR587) TaxID=928314 RepID=Q6TUY9_YMTV5|nr:Hypothetical protein YMTVg23.5L [Yaba monkey tumor virus]AAR07380.1 23.5L [Yaba monkey tumor virus]
MDGDQKMINKVVITSKPCDIVDSSTSYNPTSDEIKKYGYCLNIKKPSSNKKQEVYLRNNYPSIISSNNRL